jgi:hypothetical protein
MNAARILKGIVVAGALIVGISPAVSQTDQNPAVPTVGPDSNPEMREMMRDMMHEMMRERTGPGGAEDDNDGDFRRGWDHRGGPREGPMGWGGQGPRDGMGRGFVHGPGFRIVLAIMDKDGNGGVSQEEAQEFQARMFRVVDEDSDGQLTPEEVGDFFRGSER